MKPCYLALNPCLLGALPPNFLVHGQTPQIVGWFWVIFDHFQDPNGVIGGATYGQLNELTICNHFNVIPGVATYLKMYRSRCFWLKSSVSAGFENVLGDSYLGLLRPSV